MSISDLLYGPRLVRMYDGGLQIRSVTVDLDTLRSVVEEIEDSGLGLEVRFRVQRGFDSEIYNYYDWPQLKDLSDPDLQQLELVGTEPGNPNNVQIRAELREKTQPDITTTIPAAHGLIETIAERIVNEGRPRFRQDVLRARYLVAGPLVVLVVSVIALVFSDPSWSVALFGAVVAVAAGAVFALLGDRYRSSGPVMRHTLGRLAFHRGIRVDPMSREERRRRRRESKANIRVSAITAAVTLLISIPLTAYFSR